MTHWKAELAAAEAAAWQKENAGWAKGSPAELPGLEVSGRATAPRNVPGWDQPCWWRMDGGKVGAPAPAGQQVLGLSPWAPGWKRWHGWGMPAEEWGVVERMGPMRMEMPCVVPPREGRRERGCWGELTGAAQPLPALRQVESLPTKAEERERAHVLRMPRGQKLAPCTWVLGDARGKQGLLWAERQKQVKRQRSGEKGARVLEAELGWKTSAAEAWAARREAEGHVAEKRVSEEELAEAAMGPSPLERMAEQEELAWLLKALSPRQREAVELKAEGLTMREAAAEMGCSHVAVSKLQKKAVAAMKAALA